MGEDSGLTNLGNDRILRDSILSTKMLVANITSVVAADFIFFAAELHCPG